ncbi:MAG: DUF1097 domain-containing protein [Beijerinckiaceae bacterium]|jgi:hypothetical protein
MDMITALAVSIGLLGGVATWLFLGPLGTLGLSIWAAFIGWATFYHCGGKEAGLQKAIVNNLFGAVVAWVALLLITKVPLAGSLGLPVWAAICVAITVFVLVYAAKYPLFSDIPAGVLGYAAVVAMALAGGKLDALTAASFANPLISIAISLVIGALFGYVSEKAAGAIAK